jgi:D-alanyl-lipoteichoic acid acyltransferase DltB (MBOAT superfamily)
LENNHVEENKKPIETGMALIIRGYIKKVAIADILGTHIVDVAFSNPSGLSPVFLLLALYAYSFQVYMDFSGYTDIARGVSRCLGYELQINFNRPYKAISVGDFWQRWHISMSSFFRDYLYFGLGGSKHGNVYVNLFITFVAIGIWHGAAWNFVLYGVCHGLMVSIERWQFQKRKNRGLPSKKYKGIRLAIQMLWIFNLISITRVLFRGGSLDTTMSYLQALTDFSSIEIPLDWLGGTTLLVAIILHFTPDKWAYAWKEYYSRQPSFIQAAFIVVCIYTLIALADDSAPFIYFQF